MIKNKLNILCRIFAALFFCTTVLWCGCASAQTPGMALGFGSAINQAKTGVVTDPYGNPVKTTQAKVLDGCQPLQEKLNENQKCILCPLFEVILTTDQTMATKSFDALASSFRNVIIVVLALFVAYKTLMSVSAMTKQDVGKYLGEITVQAFKVLIAALLLSNSEYVYHYIINPLMNAALDFGMAFIGDNALKSLEEYSTTDGIPSGVISQKLLAKVLGSIKLFSKEAAELPTIGGELICISTHSATNKIGILNVPMFIEGLLCLGFGWAIALSCCFYLLDSAVRFGIFCTLLPFLIASWPFKVTFNYAKQGWGIFVNSFFNFIMMGLVLTFTSELISQALSGDSQIDLSLAKTAEQRATWESIAKLSGKDQIIAGINSDNIELFKSLMSLDGVKFLVLVACCIFAFKLVGQINALASDISGASGGENIGGTIGGLAAQGIKRGAEVAKNATIGKKDDDGHHHGGLFSGVANGLHNRRESFQNNVAARIAGNKYKKSQPNSNASSDNNDQNQEQKQPDDNDSPFQNYDEDTSSWD